MGRLPSRDSRSRSTSTTQKEKCLRISLSRWPKRQAASGRRIWLLVQARRLRRSLYLWQMPQSGSKKLTAIVWSPVLISDLGVVHTAHYLNENRAKTIRFGIAFTLMRFKYWAVRIRKQIRIHSNILRIEYAPFSVWTPNAEKFEYNGILSMEIVV